MEPLEVGPLPGPEPDPVGFLPAGVGRGELEDLLRVQSLRYATEWLHESTYRDEEEPPPFHPSLAAAAVASIDTALLDTDATLDFIQLCGRLAVWAKARQDRGLAGFSDPAPSPAGADTAAADGTAAAGTSGSPEAVDDPAAGTPGAPEPADAAEAGAPAAASALESLALAAWQDRDRDALYAPAEVAGLLGITHSAADSMLCDALTVARHLPALRALHEDGLVDGARVRAVI
ncbi:MAG TPA: hypothetical protein VIG41_03155, partial [Micrococcaceae bacterium]